MLIWIYVLLGLLLFLYAFFRSSAEPADTEIGAAVFVLALLVAFEIGVAVQLALAVVLVILLFQKGAKVT